MLCRDSPLAERSCCRHELNCAPYDAAPAGSPVAVGRLWHRFNFVASVASAGGRNFGKALPLKEGNTKGDHGGQLRRQDGAHRSLCHLVQTDRRARHARCEGRRRSFPQQHRALKPCLALAGVVLVAASMARKGLVPLGSLRGTAQERAPTRRPRPPKAGRARRDPATAPGKPRARSRADSPSARS